MVQTTTAVDDTTAPPPTVTTFPYLVTPQGTVETDPPVQFEKGVHVDYRSSSSSRRSPITRLGATRISRLELSASAATPTVEAPLEKTLPARHTEIRTFELEVKVKGLRADPVTTPAGTFIHTVGVKSGSSVCGC